MESAPLVLGATSLSFPALDVWLEVNGPFVQGGRMACGGDVRTSVGGVVVGKMMWLVRFRSHHNHTTRCFVCIC